MVRGHAKAVSQDKHNAKMADKAKSVKRDSNEASNLQSTAIMLTSMQYIRNIKVT